MIYSLSDSSFNVRGCIKGCSVLLNCRGNNLIMAEYKISILQSR